MKRLFWLSVGIVTGVMLSRKVAETVRQASPAALASNLSGAVRELASAVGSFGAEVRAGMSEREQELHEMVEHRAGVTARPRAGRHAAAQLSARRARQAES